MKFRLILDFVTIHFYIFEVYRMKPYCRADIWMIQLLRVFNSSSRCVYLRPRHYYPHASGKRPFYDIKTVVFERAEVNMTVCIYETNFFFTHVILFAETSLRLFLIEISNYRRSALLPAGQISFRKSSEEMAQAFSRHSPK